VYEHIKKRKDDAVRMLLQVHDELVFEVRDDVLEAECKKLEAIMEGVLHGQETYSVPILCDVAVGQNWADLKDL